MGTGEPHQKEGIINVIQIQFYRFDMLRVNLDQIIFNLDIILEYPIKAVTIIIGI